MLGFGAGVMAAAACFSLILPGVAAGTELFGNKPAGALVEGQSVKAKDGMEFDVTSTNRS